MTLDEPITRLGPDRFQCNGCDAIHATFKQATRCYRGDIGKDARGD